MFIIIFSGVCRKILEKLSVSLKALGFITPVWDWRKISNVWL